MCSSESTSQSAADAIALKRLLIAHTDQLLSYVTRHLPANLRQLIEPQDILQDTFFEAFQRFSEFVATDEKAAYRWLLTIARNRLIDQIRMQRAAKRGGNRLHLAEEEVRHLSVVGLLQDLAAHNRTPSQSASRRELVVILGQSLHALKPDYREVVRLRYIEGLSLSETAAQMKKTENSAQKLCGRALAALRTELKTASCYL